MDTARSTAPFKQHLIDPELCIRCNTCEATCPVGAISHDEHNYVVDPKKCNACLACVPPCPTGSIDNWRLVDREGAYTVEEQLGWAALPAERAGSELAFPDWAPEPSSRRSLRVVRTTSGSAETGDGAAKSPGLGAEVPPWSAERAVANLYGPRAPERFVTATVTGNVRVTEVGR